MVTRINLIKGLCGGLLAALVTVNQAAERAWPPVTLQSQMPAGAWGSQSWQDDGQQTEAGRRGRRSTYDNGMSMGGTPPVMDQGRRGWRQRPGQATSPWGPGSAYRYGPAGSFPAQFPPRIEAELSASSPWLHETVIYTVNLITPNPLKTLDAVFPATGSMAIEQLEGPNATVRMQGRRAEYVTRYRFAMTPLRSGSMEVPRIRLEGTQESQQRAYPGQTDGQAGAFRVAIDEPGRMEVRPPNTLVDPWLPLHDFRMEGDLRGDGSGPLSLTVRMSATGAPGDLLPSLLSQLENSDFRVYRDSTSTSQVLAADGMELQGTRRESYTLVPRHGGRLEIPVLRVGWWNLDRRRAESAQLSLPAVVADGPAADSMANAGLMKEEEPVSLFMVVIASVVVGYLGSFLITWIHLHGKMEVIKQVSARAVASMGSLVTALLAPLAAFLRRRMPRFSRQYFRYRLVMIMPPRVKLWMCSRCIEDEDAPAEWCQLFQFLACKHLDLGHHASMADISDRIIELNPGSDARHIQSLVAELNGAMYGDQQLDFPKWKKAFRAALKPGWLIRPRLPASKSALPSLNPGAN